MQAHPFGESASAKSLIGQYPERFPMFVIL